MPRLSKDAAEERRGEILVLAEKLFMRYGYEHTTVDKIVAELGLAKGTYYYHFASKEDLMFAVSEKLILETTNKLAMVYARRDQDIVWRIRNMLKTYQDDFYRNKRIWTQVYHWRNAVLYSRVARISAKRFVPVLADLLTEALEAGKIAIPHPRETAESLLVLFDLTSRQLCGKTDHARRMRVFETFRYLLSHILSPECIPQFEQEQKEIIDRDLRK